MKKINFLLVGLITLISFSAITTSCNKDDDDKNSLVGTTWVATGGGDTFTFIFTSETTVTVKYTDNGYNQTFYMTYTYNHPNVTFYDDGDIEVGVINGNILIYLGVPFYKK